MCPSHHVRPALGRASDWRNIDATGVLLAPRDVEALLAPDEADGACSPHSSTERQPRVAVKSGGQIACNLRKRRAVQRLDECDAVGP